ncbi:hypothetical protein S40288_07962 [Stachybotrys chartarum IBT 40288]|nr:hypothetical protein S40288_07962 [Stachybotrys chartarum IBT 40288]
MKSNLDLVCDTDMFPYEETDPAEYRRMHQGLYTILWKDEAGDYPIGYILERVVKELLRCPVDIRGEVDVNEQDRTVVMLQLPTELERTAQAAKLSSYWHQNKTFKVLKGWRGELLPVYSRKGELLFSMERIALGLLGCVRYGVHMIAYVDDPSAPFGVRMWVPKRAADKSTFPGMLDNTVAGGLTTGEDPLECVIREADEEASLPDALVRRSAVRINTITYIYITDEEQIGEADFIYPECQWVFHIALPADVVPQPKDGEVESFSLCDVDEVKRDLAAGKYKPNCALCVLDFFVRRGILTEENEPRLAEIQRRLHRELPFPGPHQPEWRAV